MGNNHLGGNNNSNNNNANHLGGNLGGNNSSNTPNSNSGNNTSGGNHLGGNLSNNSTISENNSNTTSTNTNRNNNLGGNLNNNSINTPVNNTNSGNVSNTVQPSTDEPVRGADDEDTRPAMEQLNDFIGLGSVKETIAGFRAFLAKNKKNKKLNIHMAFTGNPGTGKTAVARLIGKIFYEEGILPTHTFIEGDRSTLVVGYIGQTATNVHEKVKSAMGGVIFIDEAYQLANEEDHQDFGHEAVQALLKDMEDYNGKFCCILAGYTEPLEKMIATNPGFKSRIAYFVNFPDYSISELLQILELFLKKDNYQMEEEAKKKLMEYIENYRLGKKDFANAREIRETLQKIEIIQAKRSYTDAEDRLLTVEDVQTFIDSNNNNNGNLDSSGGVSHKAYHIF